jgi:transposase
MSFIQLQPVKRDGRTMTYVTLAKSERVKGQKHPRQTRIHLGRLLESGKMLASKVLTGSERKEVDLEELKAKVKSGANVQAWLSSLAPARGAIQSHAVPVPAADLPLSVETVGQAWILKQIATDIGLDAVLDASLGQQDGTALLYLAMHQVAEGRPLYVAQPWLAELCPPAVISDFDFSSPGLSLFMRRLGRDRHAAERFFESWIIACGKPASLIFDSTSISSRSLNLDLAEWGYNRDGDDLPQANLALVSARGSHLPLFYRLLPGSIPDVASLKLTVKLLEHCGLTDFSTSLDRGFYSAANVRDLINEKLDFVLGASFSCSQACQLVRRHKSALDSTKRSFHFNGTVIRHVADKWQVDMGKGKKKTIAAHVFLDPERRASMAASLEKRVFEIAEKAEKAEANGQFEDRKAAVIWLKETAKGLAFCFSIRCVKGKWKIAWKPRAVALANSRKGYTVVLASKVKDSREQVLDDYRSRDAIEKLFDILKNEIDQGRMRSGDDEIVQGRMFLAFISLILHAALENRMREADLIKRFSVSEIMAEMRKLKAVHLTSGSRIVLEITKRQREILDKLRVRQPT